MAFVIYTTDTCAFNKLLEVYAFLETVKVAMHLIPWPSWRIEYLDQVTCGTVSAEFGVNAVMFSFLLCLV